MGRHRHRRADVPLRRSDCRGVASARASRQGCSSAVSLDARGHVAPGAHEFRESLRDLGVREAVKARDSKFPDGVVRVDEPEIRDADGRFVEHP